MLGYLGLACRSNYLRLCVSQNDSVLQTNFLYYPHNQLGLLLSRSALLWLPSKPYEHTWCKFRYRGLCLCSYRSLPCRPFHLGVSSSTSMLLLLPRRLHILVFLLVQLCLMLHALFDLCTSCLLWYSLVQDLSIPLRFLGLSLRSIL